jgi:hypothetical protein
MVHNEIVCEVPKDGDHEKARREIEQITVEAMHTFRGGIV